MSGRHTLPFNVIEARGKSHLTKRDKEQRKKSQVDIPDGKIKCPKYVRENKVAYTKWKEILKILKAADVIKPSDSGALSRLCIAWSEYLDLIKLREGISNIDGFSSAEEEEILHNFEGERGERAAKMMWKKVEFIFSAQAVLTFDKAINQKMTAILQLEDRLLLNIVSRSKTLVPKPEKLPEKSKEEEMFGN